MSERKRNIQTIIDQLLNTKSHIRVLEAGCGSINKIKFNKNNYIVGIDISENQLQRNTIINEKILGDIQYYDFSPSTFDVIICWDVLEHLPKPKLALFNFFKALKEGGIIILALPNVLSFKGIVTKLTPHWFHLLVYRHIFSRQNVGKNDVGPFKTYLRFSTSSFSIKKLATNNGFEVEYIQTTDALNDWFGQELSRRSKSLYLYIKGMQKILKLISIGKIGDSDYQIILKKIKFLNNNVCIPAKTATHSGGKFTT